MKEKIIRFLKEKRDLIIFGAIILAIFGSVIGISSISLKNKDKDIPTNLPEPEDTTEPSTEISPTVTIYKIECPVIGDYEISRGFFDMSYDTEVLKEAMIISDTSIIESKGVSYKSTNDSNLSVLSVLPGRVIALDETENTGIVVTIEHNDGIISRYKSLSVANVKLNDEVGSNTIIGETGESLFDKEAGNHVHVELINNGNYVDITKVIGKESSEVSQMK